MSASLVGSEMCIRDRSNILKVSRQSVSKWESAKNYPSLDILIAMSDLFGISLEHLIKGDARFKRVNLEGNNREQQGTFHS
ncbi:hypothetical protein JMUB7546_26490 [Staphylococcus aureus]